MASNTYHFLTRWRVPGTIDEVATILDDPLALPRWWPAVYLNVQELEPGTERGVGRVIDLYTKGWLPFTLDGWGDFIGRGVWTLEQDGS